MNAQTFMENFGHLAGAPGGVRKLREMVLQLAVHGKLVRQEAQDSAAEELERCRETIGNRENKSRTSRKPQSPLVSPYEIPCRWEWAAFSRVATIASNLVNPMDFGNGCHRRSAGLI